MLFVGPVLAFQICSKKRALGPSFGHFALFDCYQLLGLPHCCWMRSLHSDTINTVQGPPSRLSVSIPHFSYAVSCFPDMSVHLQHELQRLINACVRFVEPMPWYHPVSRIRRSYKFQVCFNYGWRATLALLYKIIYADKLDCMLTTRIRLMSPGNVCLHDARVLDPSAHRAVQCSRSFLIQATRAWNRLLPRARLMRSHQAIKNFLGSLASAHEPLLDRTIFF